MCSEKALVLEGFYCGMIFTSLAMKHSRKCDAWSPRKPEFGPNHGKAGCPVWLQLCLAVASTESAQAPEAALNICMA